MINFFKNPRIIKTTCNKIFYKKPIFFHKMVDDIQDIYDRNLRGKEYKENVHGWFINKCDVGKRNILVFYDRKYLYNYGIRGVLIYKETNPNQNIYCMMHESKRYKISTLFVDDYCRNQGIGTQLLNYFFENIMEERDYCYTTIFPDTNIEPFLVKNGFKNIRDQKKSKTGEMIFYKMV